MIHQLCQVEDCINNGREIWRPIKDYEGYYEVSNIGRIKRFARTTVCNQFLRERVFTIPVKENRYTNICLIKELIERSRALHRILAEAFIPNQQNKRYINHINGLKHDNRLENLEWCTASENLLHAYHILNRPTNFRGRSYVTIPIVQKDLHGNLIKVWKSSAEASRAFKVDSSTINNAVSGRHKSSQGFKWEKL